VDLTPLVKQGSDEIEGIGALRVPGDERLLPRRELGVNIVSDFGKLGLELIDLCRIRIRSGGLLDLAPEPEDRLLELRRIGTHGE